MDMAVTSIVFLGGAIALGFWRKMNVGIISMGCAFLLGRLLLMPDKQILSGFDASLFVTLMGVTFLFSVLNENGTIKLLSSHIVQLIGSKAWLLPVTIFVVGYVLTAIGPGAIPMLAIMPAFAIPVARARGFNPLMLALIADFGVFAGRMSPITPEGILVRELINMAGVTAPLDTALIINQTLTGIVCAIVAFVYYKGYKVTANPSLATDGTEVSSSDASEITTHKCRLLPAFSKMQWFSFLALVAVVLLVVVFKCNVGLVSFVAAAVLLAFGAGDEAKAIKGVPWGVLIMVCGVGMLMKLVVVTGGIKLISSVLSLLMNEYTASMVMGLTGGIMSWFSSGLGVVFSTLIPVVGEVANMVGGSVSPVELASLVVIGGTFTGVSPFSTTGALILATIMAEKQSAAVAAEANKVTTSTAKNNHVFLSLLVWSVITLVILALLAICGVYRLFV